MSDRFCMVCSLPIEVEAGATLITRRSVHNETDFHEVCYLDEGPGEEYEDDEAVVLKSDTIKAALSKAGACLCQERDCPVCAERLGTDRDFSGLKMLNEQQERCIR